MKEVSGHVRRSTDILLIAADQRTRSLLSAQLQEAGYDVIPLVSIRQALLVLQRCLIPRLVILDCAGLAEGQRDLTALLGLAPVPLLLLASALDPPPIESSGTNVVTLVRPFSISDIVERAQALLDSSDRARSHPPP